MIAKSWGGKITKAAENQCFAPVDTTNLDSVARCQSLNVDSLKGMSSAIEQYQLFFNEKSQKAIDKKYGTVKFFNDAILQERLDDMHE